MNILLIFLIITDVLLLIVILCLIFKIYPLTRQKDPICKEKSINELKALMTESGIEAANFLQNIDEKTSRIAELINLMDEKERQIWGLIERAGGEKRKETGKEREKTNYDEIILLLKQGLSEKEIALSTGLTEGEVSLVADLYHRGAKL